MRLEQEVAMQTLLAAGTSEGVKKAWEARRGGNNPPSSPTEAELYHHIHNSPSTEKLWHRQGSPIQQNLAQKYNKGTYDHSKAPQAWKGFTDTAAKDYDKQHSFQTGGGPTFSPQVRRNLAQHMADEFHGYLKTSQRSGAN